MVNVCATCLCYIFYVVFQGEINLNLGELDLTSEDFWLDEVDGTVHYIFISGLTVKIIRVSIYHGPWACFSMTTMGAAWFLQDLG